MNRCLCTMLVLSALLLAGCTGRLPAISPEAPAAPCRRPFLSGQWQLTHTVAVTVAGQVRGALIGVSRVDAGARAVHCVLMTVEGMVVFEAKDDGDMTVIRALPPFDDPAWAGGLIADVRLLFLPPVGPPAEAGGTADHQAVCRYIREDGTAMDVMPSGGGGWALLAYDTRRRLRKTVTATALTAAGPAGRIELTDHGLPGYTLTMTLIDAQMVDDAAPSSKK